MPEPSGEVVAFEGQIDDVFGERKRLLAAARGPYLVPEFFQNGFARNEPVTVVVHEQDVRSLLSSGSSGLHCVKGRL